MNWRTIQDWCLGANDRFGTCAFAMVGNCVVLLGKGVMSDGEIESAARAIEGFSAYDPTTDHGERLETLFDYIKQNGWPGDPTLTIKQWKPVALPEIGAVIARRTSAPLWLMLPKLEDGSDYDFSDDAMDRGASGVDAHAVLAVETDGRTVTFITWARPVTVSWSWAQCYFRGIYDVEWTDIA